MKIKFIFLIVIFFINAQEKVNKIDGYATGKWYYLGPFKNEILVYENDIINKINQEKEKIKDGKSFYFNGIIDTLYWEFIETEGQRIFGSQKLDSKISTISVGSTNVSS